MGKAIPLGKITGRLPDVSLRKQVNTLRELNESMGEKKAYKRYGCCWDLFPSAFTVEDLDRTANEIRKHLISGFISTLVMEKPPDYSYVYENLKRDKLLNMLKCLHSLRLDLREINGEYR